MFLFGKTIKNIYPNIIHVTCLDHGLQRLYETVRLFYSDVNELILNGEKFSENVLLGSKSLKHLLRVYPFLLDQQSLVGVNILNFQSLVVFIIFKLCKGTWLHAAKYYTDYFENMYKVIFSLEEDDAASIGIAQGRLTKPNIKSQLTYICANFLHPKYAILEIEKKPLVSAVNAVLNI